MFFLSVVEQWWMFSLSIHICFELPLCPSWTPSDFVVVRIPQSELRRGAALHTVSPVGNRTASSLQPHLCPDQLLVSSGLQHIFVLWGKQLQPLALIWVEIDVEKLSVMPDDVMSEETLWFQQNKLKSREKKPFSNYYVSSWASTDTLRLT